MKRIFAAALTIAAAIGSCSEMVAQSEGTMVGASTERTVRDLNTHHLFSPPPGLSSWERRADQLRKQILFSAGLWPMPPKTPLDPVVTRRQEFDDFVVENVAIQTLPGFYLGGNLYLPKGRKGPFPAIANPHGHTATGRFQAEPDVPPAEPPPAPPAKGSHNLPAIGVSLARQGFVVFAYDMLGYNDTSQTPDHRQFANNPRDWMWGVSAMGLQLWNSIRVVDYLQSRPEVDPGRIGATGGSGGGSQTFLLAAVDDRVGAAVPVNMVSAHMQGGCLCENGPGLRLYTDNVEIAALMAPRPLLLVAATGDWTKNNPDEEWPAIKSVYDLYGAGDRTKVVQFNYGHNYNIDSREAMYAWFGQWLGGDVKQNTRERPHSLDASRLRVWGDGHPLPENALTQDGVVAHLVNRRIDLMKDLTPADAGSLTSFKELMRPALESALGVKKPLPSASLEEIATGKKPVLVVVAERPGLDFASSLQKRGLNAFLLMLPPVTEPAEKLWSKFYTCYNQTELGERTQSILDALSLMRREGHRQIRLVGLGEAGLWTLLARGIASGVGPAAIDCAGFDNKTDAAFLEKLYAPGLRAIGDLTTAAILGAPGSLFLFGTNGKFETEEISNVYKTLGAPLEIREGPMDADEIASRL